jgi:hypothetical protein
MARDNRAAAERGAAGARRRVERLTVDLAEYPDLVVIYLGMRVNMLTGLKTLLGFGPQIAKAVDAKPDGLLLHENFLWSLFPPHAGMREYWRDFESLEAWTRSQPHRDWWRRFLRDSGGTGFWHETHFRRGGMEGVYDDMAAPTGAMRFAPLRSARGGMFSARRRLGIAGEPAPGAPLDEAAFYGAEEAASRPVSSNGPQAG